MTRGVLRAWGARAAAWLAAALIVAPLQAQEADDGADTELAAKARPAVGAYQRPAPDALAQSRATPIADRRGRALRPLHRALRAAATGQGQARIIVYGASHTAADLWTGHLRRALQQRFGDAGHGYLLPVRWHVGVRHQDVVIDSSKGWTIHRHRELDPVPIVDAGFGGAAASSASSDEWAKISTCTDNVCGRAADRLELWLRGGPLAGSLRVRVDGGPEQLVSARQPRQGVRTVAIALGDGGHNVELRPAGDGETWLYGITFERSAPGVIVDNAGIPGMRADIWQHWRADHHVRLLRHREPHLVVLAYGTNDVGDDAPPAEAQLETWRRLLTRLRVAAPRAGCLIVGPTDRPLPPDKRGQRAPRPKIDAVIAMQRRVAAELGCGHWDAFAAMGGHGAMGRWLAAGLGRPDHVHLTPAGYAVLAERWLEALLTGLPEGLRRTAPTDPTAASAPTAM